MSYTLPPLKSLFPTLLHHSSQAASSKSTRGYSDFSKILVGGTSCLGKRSASPSPEVTPTPSKRLRISNERNERQATSRFRSSLPLPHEIHNYILETFWNHDDIQCSSPETIRACSLTCKTWNKVARRHIFRAITLKCADELESITSLVINDKDIIGWIQRVRLYGSLTPLDKETAGKTLPPDWGIQDRWIYKFPSSLASRIRDKTHESYQPFNVKIFELFDFSHLSGAVEDCRWFAFWIYHLPWLENVEKLYLKSCEMPSNAMAAIAYSFPRLRKVGLTDVDFTANDHAIIEHISAPYNPTEEELQNQRLAMCAHLGVTMDELMSSRIPRNGVKYIAIHPPPAIESLYLNRTTTQYEWFDLMTLYTWIHSSVVARSLRSLELSKWLNIDTVAHFLNRLGPSPSLEHLTIWVACNVDLLVECGFNFSQLTNLKSIALHSAVADQVQVEVFVHVLSTLKASQLRYITLAIRYRGRIMTLEPVDNCISGQFKNLEMVVIECVGREGDKLNEARQEIEEMFPQLSRRGMLRVQNYVEPFLSY
ncbi:hypothetical protein QCA50_014640 [Cerrena zonata]|uniref:F-box domain-containing protein n=1 Tax=Cerrena zonata TaxID=2478898 RepID=A0AAW0G0A1_9APHY